jgi:hypothetical protein
MPVGESFGRTKFKHTALNKFSGQVAGAASCMGRVDKVIFIDACAGDGHRSVYSGTSSAEIFAKHLCWLKARGCRAKAYLIEANHHTFMRLEAAMSALAQEAGFEQLPEILTLIRGDYRSAQVAAQIDLPTEQTVTFLHIDPNHVDDVELSESLRTRLSLLTTWMVSLGCNANGTKRMPWEERRKWFDRLEYLLSVLEPHQDASLICLDRDEAQWAYLLSIPRKWRDKTQATIRSLSLLWPKGIRCYWHSEGTLLPAAKELFLTKAELTNMS